MNGYGPRPAGAIAIPLPRFTLAGCEAGAHHAVPVADRDGVWLWACLRCPAVREQGDPTWRSA